MPAIFSYDGFRFFFYSNEGDPREPLHVHVRKGGAEAKIWLKPEVSVGPSTGFDARTLRILAEKAVENFGLIERAWNEYFGG